MANTGRPPLRTPPWLRERLSRPVKALAAAFLALSSPALAQELSLVYQQAVAARQAGDNERAVSLLEDLVRVHPENADAQLQLGLALLALGHLDEAEIRFRTTLELAPGYTDAVIGLARVAQRRGDVAAARQVLAKIDPANGEVADFRRELARSRPRPWRLDVDLTHSDLDSGQPDWNGTETRLAYKFPSNTTLGADLQWAHRFGHEDTYAEVRLDRRESADLYYYVGVGGTPHADFLPEWQVSAGGGLRAIKGANPTIVTVDGRQAKYPEGDIQTLNPGVEQYLLGGRAWLTARWINVFDSARDHHLGWLLRSDLLATKSVRLFAGAANAPDTSEGVVTRVRALFGGISWDVSDDLTLRASLTTEDRDSGSDRLEYAMGLSVRF